jgi:L-alanine-DL-glutamate epimerase-like enolase superfamily enzyme
MARQDSKTLSLTQPDPAAEETTEATGRRKGKTISLAQPDAAAAAAEEPVPELLGRRKRPEVGQFRLLVDRQTKASFATYEAAEKAAMAIKTGHPIVSVVVYDAKAGENHVMELEKK